MAKAHTSKIELNVELDENRIPEKLSWTAQDGGISNADAKAIFLSVWDSKAKESLGIVEGRRHYIGDEAGIKRRNNNPFVVQDGDDGI